MLNKSNAVGEWNEDEFSEGVTFVTGTIVQSLVLLERRKRQGQANFLNTATKNGLLTNAYKL